MAKKNMFFNSFWNCNMIGAYIASRLAVKKGAKFVRGILLMALVAMATKLFGVFVYLV